MKSFLLFISILFSVTAFGQKQFYGTISINYSLFDYQDYNSGTNFNQTIKNASLNPSAAVGIGYQLPINQKMSGNFLVDLTYLSGNADYNSSYWLSKLEGKLAYKGLEIRLIPQFNFKFTKKINTSVGILLGLRAVSSWVRGESTTYGSYENGQFITHPSPIVNASETQYIDFPWSSTGLTAAINYKLKPSFELFGRYILERNNTSGYNTFAHINQFSIGINYYFKSENQ